MKYLSILCLAALVSCNSAMIYETEKVSLTVESRSDPSQPVSGNFGIKQRVAMVVPQADSEAASVISYFNLEIDDGMLINTVLLTGDVAADLKEQESQKAFAAVAPTSAGSKELSYKIGTLGQLKALAGKFEDASLKAKVDQLWNKAFKEINVTSYKYDCLDDALKTPAIMKSGTTIDNMDKLISYFFRVNKSIENVSKASGAVTVGGKALTVNEIIEYRKNLETEINEIQTKLGSSKSYQEFLRIMAAKIQE